MDATIKKFYSEDASYKHLNQKDQIRNFNNWALRHHLNKELCFPEAKKYGIKKRIINASFTIALFVSIKYVHPALIFPIGIAYSFYDQKSKQPFTNSIAPPKSN